MRRIEKGNMMTMSKARIRGGVRIACALLGSSMLSSAALAADADAAAASAATTGSDTSQDIVVTATRRDTKLQETPLSITAVTGAALTNAGVTTSAGLSKVAPNLIIRSNSTGVGSRLIVRNIYAVGEPIVGLYYDDSPVVSTTGTAGDAGSTTPTVRLFDVDHIEVLRGPQGTLFGASSMAGNVRLIFAKPDLEKFSGAYDGSVSTVAHGGTGWESNAMINVPLINDVLGIRAVGYYSDTPGYVDNPVLGRKDINAQKSRGRFRRDRAHESRGHPRPV
jgi:iron complex outermembrane recepter protein